MSAGYQAWGHSMIVDPWAKVLCEAGEGEERVESVLDPETLEEVRRNIPVSTQRRFGVYPDVANC